jgi:hypothetical protein
MTFSKDDSNMENACDSPISLLLVQALFFQEQITLRPL